MRKKRLSTVDKVSTNNEKTVDKLEDCVDTLSTQYPALLYALADPIKRANLRRICESLKNHNQLRNVYYGCGDTSVPFDIVNEYIAVLT